ncbi:hypothetical protein [Streptomyces chartreusis]|uniref:hypothetical protein n=1 Tax=Streptomyces chartreusis TaxID=1969 RepID=UPI0033E34270
MADEPVPSIPQTEPQHIWLFDTRQVSNPVSISTFPVVSGPLGVPHGKVGPHNLFEPRPGLWQSDDYVFATQHTAGVYVYDVTDPYRPTEAACFVSTPGTGPLADLGCVDVTVNSEGVVFITDAGNGLRVCEFI